MGSPFFLLFFLFYSDVFDWSAKCEILQKCFPFGIRKLFKKYSSLRIKSLFFFSFSSLMFSCLVDATGVSSEPSFMSSLNLKKYVKNLQGFNFNMSSNIIHKLNVSISLTNRQQLARLLFLFLFFSSLENWFYRFRQVIRFW